MGGSGAARQVASSGPAVRLGTGRLIVENGPMVDLIAGHAPRGRAGQEGRA
jgi:hypothetical protein